MVPLNDMLIAIGAKETSLSSATTNLNIPQPHLDNIKLIKAANIQHVRQSKRFNSVEAAEINQWLEYFLSNNLKTRSVLQAINEFLQSRTYFIQEKISVIDVILFQLMKEVVIRWSALDKLEFNNISRWFDSLQADGRALRGFKPVNFNLLNHLKRFYASGLVSEF